jgi:acetolactate synthase small subunit
VAESSLREATGRDRNPPGGLSIFWEVTMTHIVSVLVENKPGVLLRVAGVLAARAINIERLIASQTNEPGISRITFAFKEDEEQLHRILPKIDRLVNVIETKKLSESQGASREFSECECLLRSWWTGEEDTTSVRT